jgi:hypothetical protein
LQNETIKQWYHGSQYSKPEADYNSQGNIFFITDDPEYAMHYCEKHEGETSKIFTFRAKRPLNIFNSRSPDINDIIKLPGITNLDVTLLKFGDWLYTNQRGKLSYSIKTLSKSYDGIYIFEEAINGSAIGLFDLNILEELSSEPPEVFMSKIEAGDSVKKKELQRIITQIKRKAALGEKFSPMSYAIHIRQDIRERDVMNYKSEIERAYNDYFETKAGEELLSELIL